MTPEILEAAQGDSILEKLRAALVSLGRHKFVFYNWHQCTCGHIYRAALGRGASSKLKVLQSEDASFRALLQVVVDAHDLTPIGDTIAALSDAVSYHTITVADELYPDVLPKTHAHRKAAAVKIIERAIEFEQDRNERARLALIGS